MAFSVKNHLLWEAFEKKNEKKFVHLLEMGANPEEECDEEISWTIFELLCGKDLAAFYLKKCIEHGADPNRMNPMTGQHPIHIAVKYLKLENIKVLLEADADCANQTFKADKAPLHLVVELVDDFNVTQVFEIVKVLADFGADFCWPAHRSNGETPFSALLKNLGPLKDKAPAVPIIRFLIQRYPQIGKFHKYECANLMREHFEELIVEYTPDERGSEPSDDWTNMRLKASEKDWWMQLISLLKHSESEFLMRLKTFKQANRKLVEDTLSEQKFANLTDDLLDLAIEHDRFESFVEIFSMMSETVNMDYVVQETLHYERHKILKFMINHPKISRILESWLLTIVQKMDWKQSANNCCHKCFYMLLNHPKFNIGGETSDCYNEGTLFYELNCAASESEDATLALLKRGASLGTRDRTNRMMVQYLDDEVLRTFLDSCITTRKPQNMSDNDFFLVIDFSFLESPKEMLPIEYISTAPNLQPLIVHPVIASFMFLKWLQLSSVLYLNLLLFSVNTISSCLFFIVFYVDPNQMSDDSAWTFITLKIVTIFSFFIFLLKEVFQLVSSPKAYLRSAENYFEIGLLGVMGMALFTPLGDGRDQFRRIITSIFIMGIAFEWTLMFSALPMFSDTNYIVMLKKVAVSFLRMLAFYSVILMAFALSFYTLIGAPMDPLSNSTDASELSMHTTIFQTILMMTGDFGLDTENDENVWIFRIFLIIFILSITIVLMNLLLGLTISDTAAIESQAELHNWMQRAKLLNKYESMVSNCHKYLKRFGWDQKLEALIQLIPDFLPMKMIKIEITPNVTGTWICIPKTGQSDLFKEDSRFASSKKSDEILVRSFFGLKSTVKMDKRIVNSALEILERRKQLELEMEQEKMKQAYQDSIEQKLNQLLNS